MVAKGVVGGLWRMGAGYDAIESRTENWHTQRILIMLQHTMQLKTPRSVGGKWWMSYTGCQGKTGSSVHALKPCLELLPP
jgi:hypothetical protein